VSSQSDGSVSSVLTVARPILQLDGKLHEEATAKSRAGGRPVFLDTKTARLLLRLAARRQDGSLRPFTIMWVVGAGDDLYVRSAGGPERPWYRTAVASRARQVRPLWPEHRGSRDRTGCSRRDYPLDQIRSVTRRHL
jgi:hypothetical protein